MTSELSGKVNQSTFIVHCMERGHSGFFATGSPKFKISDTVDAGLVEQRERGEAFFLELIGRPYARHHCSTSDGLGPCRASRDKNTATETCKRVLCRPRWQPRCLTPVSVFRSRRARVRATKSVFFFFASTSFSHRSPIRRRVLSTEPTSCRSFRVCCVARGRGRGGGET